MLADETRKVDIAETRRRINDALRKRAIPEDLVKVAEALGVEVAFIPEKSLRPCFGPDQVRCAHQIKEGLEYRHMGVGGDRGVLIVIREPFFETRGVKG